MKNSNDDNKQVLNISRIDFYSHIERLIVLKKSHHSSPNKSKKMTGIIDNLVIGMGAVNIDKHTQKQRLTRMKHILVLVVL